MLLMHLELALGILHCGQVHRPATQTRPAAQAALQAPQFLASVATSASQPSLGSMLQSAKPCVHEATAHTWLAHTTLVFGGGLHFSRCGWETQLGPGRHPISSAYFWYFKNPAGALCEYCADEDQLTAAWQPRDFEPGPTVFAEWAVAGGLDGHTRRQKNAAGPAPAGKFLTEKP